MPILQMRTLRLPIAHWPKALADDEQTSGVLIRSTSGNLMQRQKGRPCPGYLEGETRKGLRERRG